MLLQGSEQDPSSGMYICSIQRTLSHQRDLFTHGENSPWQSIMENLSAHFILKRSDLSELSPRSRTLGLESNVGNCHGHSALEVSYAGSPDCTERQNWF
jgi:hypothetical protein